MLGLVLLEANLCGLFDASSDCEIRGIGQFDLKEKDKILKDIRVFKQEELCIACGKEAEIQDPTQSTLSKIMCVFLTIFGQAYFRQYGVQTRQEINRLELGPVRI